MEQVFRKKYSGCWQQVASNQSVGLHRTKAVACAVRMGFEQGGLGAFWWQSQPVGKRAIAANGHCYEQLAASNELHEPKCIAAFGMWAERVGCFTL